MAAHTHPNTWMAQAEPEKGREKRDVWAGGWAGVKGNCRMPEHHGHHSSQ